MKKIQGISYYKLILASVINSDLNLKYDSGKSKKIIINLTSIIYAFVFILFYLSIVSIILYSQINNRYDDELLGKIGSYFSKNILSLFVYNGVFISLFIFILIDFFLRWFTYDINKMGLKKYFIFLIKPTTLFYLLSLTPFIFNTLKLYFNIDVNISNDYFNENILVYFMIFRILSFMNLIPGIKIFRNVIIKEKNPLLISFLAIFISIISFSFIFYQLETSEKAVSIAGGKENLKIKSYLDSIYFSTISMTTIGYGDISPITNMGKIFIIFFSILNIVFLAVPSGIFAAGFLHELKDIKSDKQVKRYQK